MQWETQVPQRAQVDLIIATVVLIWAVASFCVGVKRYSDGGKRMVCSDAVEQLDNPFDIAADGGDVSHVARIWNLDADEELLRSMDFGVSGIGPTALQCWVQWEIERHDLSADDDL